MDIELIELLDAEIGKPTPPRPKGFGITVKEYMDAKNVSKQVAQNILEKAVRLGLMDRQQMTIGAGNAPYVYFKKCE